MSQQLSQAEKTCPYPSLRSVQKDGIEAVQNIAEKNGVLVLEGACGTGKTAIATIPSVNMVQDNSSPYQRMLVVTSVKQQMNVFEETVREINEDGEPRTTVSSLTMVGLTDLNPYVLTGHIQKGDASETIQRLRDNTHELVENSSNKVGRAQKLYTSVETNSDNPSSLGGKQYPFPYIDEIPESEEGLEYDPFYAKLLFEQFTNDSREDVVIPFSLHAHSVVTKETLIEAAGGRGFSPHSVMKNCMDVVDIIIGNYNHVFDPMTTRMTEDLLSNETILVVDEAHNLEKRVRDLRSESLALSTISGTRGTVEEVHEWLKEGHGSTSHLSDKMAQVANKAHALLEQSQYTIEDVENFIEFLDIVDQQTNQVVEDSYKYNNIVETRGDDKLIPLREPEDLTESDLRSTLGKENLQKNALVGTVIDGIWTAVHEEEMNKEEAPDTNLEAISFFFNKWASSNPVMTFPSIKLEERGHTNITTSSWDEEYTAHLSLENCVPREYIKNALEQFGCSILMSATLKPIDAFKDVTGVLELEEENDTPVEERVYGLRFPQENRATLGIEANMFIGSNRGSPDEYDPSSNDSNETRDQYREVITSVSEEAEGNTLIVMPSYREAEWAYNIVENDTTVPNDTVILDESSSDEITEKRKQKFFTSDEKHILITSARGTLTEGVDYKGDRLEVCLVCGVPNAYAGDPFQQAVKAAYEHPDLFGDDGTEYFYSVPATRKARQAIGRVIRSDTDEGLRILCDERYTSEHTWSSVYPYLGNTTQEEMKTLDAERVRDAFLMWYDDW